MTTLVALEQLHPAPWNPRRIEKARLKNLAESIKADPTFLLRRPILAQQSGEIYAGNQRWYAAQLLFESGWLPPWGAQTVPADLDEHEPAMYGWRKHPPFYGDRSESTVWEVEHEGGIKTRNSPAMALLGLGEHPTQKPPELWARAMRNHTTIGDLVYDPFAGSGPCVTAGEQLARRTCSMDIEPAYCDVIVRRWERVSGRQAHKANA